MEQVRIVIASLLCRLPEMLLLWNRSWCSFTCFVICQESCLYGAGDRVALHALSTVRNSSFMVQVLVQLCMLCQLQGMLPLWSRSLCSVTYTVDCQERCIYGAGHCVVLHTLSTARNAAFMEQVIVQLNLHALSTANNAVFMPQVIAQCYIHCRLSGMLPLWSRSLCSFTCFVDCHEFHLSSFYLPGSISFISAMLFRYELLCVQNCEPLLFFWFGGLIVI